MCGRRKKVLVRWVNQEEQKRWESLYVRAAGVLRSDLGAVTYKQQLAKAKSSAMWWRRAAMVDAYNVQHSAAQHSPDGW